MRTETIQYQEGVPVQVSLPWQVPLLFAAFIAIIFIGITLNKRKKQVFETLSTFLQGTVSGGAFLGVFKFNGSYSGRPLRIKYTPQGKHTPAWLSVSMGEPPYLFDLSVTEEHLLTGTLKAIGLAKDIETGDPVFDKRLKASSDTPDLAAGWLADAGRRDSILSIFNAGAYELQFVPRGVTIGGLLRMRKQGPDLEKDLAMSSLMPLLEAMDRLCSEKQGAQFFGQGPQTGFGVGRHV